MGRGGCAMCGLDDVLDWLEFCWRGARVVVSGGNDDSVLFCDLIKRRHADWMCSSPSRSAADRFFRRKVCLFLQPDWDPPS